MDWPIFILFISSIISADPHVNCEDQNCLESNAPCYDDRNLPQRCLPDFHNIAHAKKPAVTNTCNNLPFCMQTRNPSVFLPRRCEICDQYQHAAQYMTDFNQPDHQTWWQSDTMLEGIQYPNSVNITFQLGKTYHITYIAVIFFNSRPESYAIYRKKHPANEWTPWHYFSGSCRSTFKLPDRAPVLPGKEAIPLCTSEFSDISPTSNNRVVFQPLDSRPSGENLEESEELQEWVTASEVMISLTRLNTYGDEIFGDSDVKRSYYYSISDIAIGGRCQCNGHARECVPSTGPGINKMVCKCEHNTAGVDCEECAPLFHDRPWRAATGNDANECLPCECNGLASSCFFDEKLYNETQHGGHCIDCRGFTTGPNCELCLPGHHRIPGRKHCSPCNCDENGSLDSECNANGECKCKDGVTGLKCNECKPGYEDFSPLGCKDCQCSNAGSFRNTPRCQQGQCICKTNVEGQRCDRCKPGFFNLDANNTAGCSPCFCHGHSSDCVSAPGFYRSIFWIELAEDNGWKVNNGIPHQDPESSIEFVEYQNGHDPIYFDVPKEILKNIKPYPGQKITFKFRKDSEHVPLSRRDVIITGNGFVFSVPLTAQNNPLPKMFDQQYEYKLEATYWNPRVPDIQFLSALTNLSSIKIRMTYAPRDRAYLSAFTLITASSVPSEPILPTNVVEQCRCPLEYTGMFCESCASGYTKEKNSENAVLRKCIKCECNGHSESCDAETGKCFCQHNTIGDNCNQCARGFYGDPVSGASDSCKSCECPDGGPCVIIGGQVYCTECREGHTGQRCDYCAEDYFGNPKKGIPCKKCVCNDNIDPNYIQQCDRTGKCLNCYYNTTGFDCEKCAPGFWGDATKDLKGDCQLCNCYTPGTRRPTTEYKLLECDQNDGQCNCQPNVVGLHCDRCEDGYFNLTSGNGCEQCDCELIGSVNQTCDVITGLCHCKPGVSGRRCDQCSPYHFGLNSDGCKSCDCDAFGSTSRQCNIHTGQCNCKENVTGRRCDQCSENRYNLQQGCLLCDDCYVLIQKRKDFLNDSILALEDSVNYIQMTPVKMDDAEFDEAIKNTEKELLELRFDLGQHTQNSFRKDLESVEEEIREAEGKVKQVLFAAENDQVSHDSIKRFNIEKEDADNLLMVGTDLISQLRGVLSSARENKNMNKNDRLQKKAQEVVHLNKEMDHKNQEITALAEKFVTTGINISKHVHQTVFGNNASQEIHDLEETLERTKDTMASLKGISEFTLEETEQILTESALILSKVESAKIPDVTDLLDDPASFYELNYDDNVKNAMKTLEDVKIESQSTNYTFFKAKKQHKKIKKTLKTIEKERDKALNARDSALQIQKTLEETLQILQDPEGLIPKQDYFHEIEKADGIKEQLIHFENTASTLETQLKKMEFEMIQIQNLHKKVGYETRDRINVLSNSHFFLSVCRENNGGSSHLGIAHHRFATASRGWGFDISCQIWVQ
uniref:BMA-LAM-1 n=1 Tax=Bursaphelenchus xylophilus TaxID=6326 RepID=A0A1I7SML4_BURXY